MRAKLPGPAFVIDSREQQPYSLADAITAALPTGDYSLAGRSDVAFERKSVGDLLGCIGGERDRFERELTRLSEIRYRGLIIEGTLKETMSPAFRRLHPNAI